MFNLPLKKNKSKTLSEEESLSVIVKNPVHHWIDQHKYVRSAFQELVFRMSPEHRYNVLVESPTIFLPSSGSYSCVISKHLGPVILVFPELIKYLKATRPDYALAILAHELGHILRGHHEREIDVLESQVEADRYVCELGWGQELEFFLTSLQQSVETRVRISYITRYLIQHGQF